MSTDTAPSTEEAATAPEIAPDGPPADPGTNPPPEPPEAPERAEGAPGPEQYLPAPAHPETGIVTFNERQRQVAKSVLGADLTEDELDFFLSRSMRTGLDPFAGQIHVWKDKGTLVTMTSIDGLRLVGARTGHLKAQRGPEWMTATGDWVDVWAGPATRDEQGKPVMPEAARFFILRDDQDEWIAGVAPWAEFNKASNRNNRNWQPTGMPAHMLAKVAEAIALRRAFPNELSGVYTDDEIDTATSLATASAGSDDLPSVDDPLAVAATEVYLAIQEASIDDARKLDRYWADNYVKKVLETTLGKAKSLKTGALYRFAPGSPHIAFWADLLQRAAVQVLGPTHERTVALSQAKAAADADAAAGEGGESGEPLPSTEEPPSATPTSGPTPTPTAPVEQPGPFTDAQRLILDALSNLGIGTVADIAANIGITEAASLRVEIQNLFTEGLIQLSATQGEPGTPRAYERDEPAIADHLANHQGAST